MVFFPVFLAASIPAVLASVVPQNACSTLNTALPGKVFLPLSVNYVDSLTSYYSAQESSVTPSCIVQPADHNDVSVAVKTLYSLHSSNSSVSFAVRGGGHTPWAGSANVAGGVTIDMRSINQIQTSADQTVTSVGAGAVWQDVYDNLDPKNLSVSGGRVGPVGVGGLTIGGGISYYSTRKGFVCDNVVNFELVLADGSIVNANSTSNADLWVALRGGSSNFGIVTRYDLATFAQGPFWGGTIYYPLSTAPAQITGYTTINSATAYDEYSAVILSFFYSGGQSGVTSHIEYTAPTVDPPSLQPLTHIEPQYQSTMRIASISSFAAEQAEFSVNGQRQLFYSVTFKTTSSFLTTVFNLWNATAVPLSSHITGLSYSLTLEPLPPALTSKSAALGGNVLGLQGNRDALSVCLLTVSWSLASDDKIVQAAAQALFADINARAKNQGLYNPFIYLNYADRSQNPIDGYGAANKAKLQAASHKYDPSGFFQKALPGGFKVFAP